MLKELIEQDYLINILNIVKNNDSTDGNVYMIDCEENRYVLKIYNSRNHAISMAKMHSFLFRNNFNVPNILLNKKDKYYTEIGEDEYAVVYYFLCGNEIANILEKKR